ncbi:helix-turn-helix transcriptional regulator [Paraburkholderia saeva]|uniref:helix-turn-helix transcriptional regulator n=1 Tax=Paraburkholderia saeva TaxID=2777537 RepID=UPI001E01F020|nr:AlpA family phage regulatory protein [Paraburkholderia saeva]CAG4910217.1 hypothetical protein R52603_03802 [Paraburkholderia saeva]
MTNEMRVNVPLHEKGTILPAGGRGHGAETLKKTLIDLQELKSLTAQSRSSIYAKSDPKNPSFDRTFPKRLYIGAKSVRWKLGEVLDWIDSRPRAGEFEAAEGGAMSARRDSAEAVPGLSGRVLNESSNFAKDGAIVGKGGVA